MEPTLERLGGDLADILDMLKRAERDAGTISGEEGGRSADPEYGVPEIKPVEGWPAMVALANAIAMASHLIHTAMTPEILKAIEDDRAYDDEMSDRADAMSY